MKISNKLALESIVSHMPGHVYWKNAEGTYLGCNDRQARFLGLEKGSDVIGKTDFELPWPMEAAEEFRKNDIVVMQSGASIIAEETIQQNGRTLHLLSEKIPLKDENGNVIGILGISVDITLRVKMETALKIAKEKAEAANQAKSNFIANMSHDIRTPLAGLLGMAQTIQAQTNQDSIRQCADLLIFSGEELLNLLNEILEVTHIESGHTHQKSNDFLLTWLIKHNETLLMPAALHKNLTMRSIIDPHLPDALYGNEKLLNRILLNLVSNAIKFTEKGSVTIKANLVSHHENHIMLELIVEDTGIGIPENKIDGIFEHFTRLSHSYQGIYKGSGLGLFTVKHYLQKIKGHIKVLSEPGKGSQFIVHVPLQKSRRKLKPPAPHMKSSPIELPHDDDKPVAKILMIEDHPLVANAQIAILKKLGCELDYASNGKTALKKITKKLYDFIYLDIGLPDIDGITLAKQIRSMKNSLNTITPILALTAHISQQRKMECYAVGFQEIIIKPLMFTVAQQNITQYVSKPEAKQPINDNAPGDIKETENPRKS